MKPVNLLPEAQRRHKPTGDGKSAFVLIGVLSLLLVLTAAYVVTANSVTTKTNDAAEARVEADRLEARAAEIGAFGDFATIKQTRLASVQQLSQSRFDWERLMRELARVMPPGGWLQKTNASVTGSPDGAEPADSALLGSPTAVLTGCMPRQADVAKLMLRLNRMHRVEDVTLQESTKGERDAAPSLENCGPLYQFGLTVTFSPAQPVEAPDGRRSVPVSLGGGS